MHNLYLAGPIEYVTDTYSQEWRQKATAAARGRGIHTIDPTFYDGIQDGLSAAEVVIRDTFLLEKSDAVLADGRKPGWGTGMEILRAYQLGKIVVVWGCEKPSLFLLHHTAKFVETPEEGVEYVEKLLRLM